MDTESSRLRPLAATEAAAWLRVSEETLRAWTNWGEVSYLDLRQVPSGEPGPGLHYTVEALEDLVRRRTRRASVSGGRAKAERPSTALSH